MPRSLRSESQWSPGCLQPPPWQNAENVFLLSSFSGSTALLCLLFVTCGNAGLQPGLWGRDAPFIPQSSVQPREFRHGLRVQPGILCTAGTRGGTDTAGIKSAGTFPFPAFCDLEILPWPHAETNYCHSQKFLKGQKVMKGQNHCIFCTIWYLYQYLWLTGTDWRTEFDVDCCRHGRQCIIKMNFSKCLNSLHI